MRVAIYARYSSDNQRDASIDDQFRECRQFAQKEGWKVEEAFSDYALTGDNAFRPGFQALLREARRGRFDIVLGESLDRFSRDQEDTAALFKRLSFAGVRFMTLSEGDITPLHIGLKGTMNAMYLKDLADKTRRGLRGRVERGASGGGLSYGYRVLPPAAGATENGHREIDRDQAMVIDRIFTDYVAGVSPKAIAKRLNAERVPGPHGSAWSPSTIHGNVKRGTGILNNELYIGRLVWNRQRFVKDPDTGKRQARLNPPSAWITTDVPDLRIISDELWQATKTRQSAVRRVWTDNGRERYNKLRRPRYIFSGLTKCSECGGGYIMYWRDRLACFSARSRGTCTNRLTISRQEVEERVLRALREKLMRPDVFQEFHKEYVRELNRLRMEHRARTSQMRHELATAEREIQGLIDAILKGVPAETVKDRIVMLEGRKAELKDLLTDREVPQLIHTSMADIYRQKVSELCTALERAESSTEAREAIRGLVDKIVLTPDGNELKIMLHGELGNMLKLAQDAKRSPETGDLMLQVQLVAGARNRRYLQISFASMRREDTSAA